MRESSYYGTMKKKLVQEIGGMILKISDRATLGLPDSSHVRHGVVVYLETKIYDIHNQNYIIPWNVIKKDVRQFEKCREIRKHTLVLYVIYCPNIKMTAVLDVNTVYEKFYRNEVVLLEGPDFVHGHGIEVMKKKINEWSAHVRRLNFV